MEIGKWFIPWIVLLPFRVIAQVAVLVSEIHYFVYPSTFAGPVVILSALFYVSLNVYYLVAANTRLKKINDLYIPL
jgi:hypothetical protein